MEVLTEKEFLKKLCSFPHRKTPGEFGDQAAKFIIGELKKIGLEPTTETVRSTRFSFFWYHLLHFASLFITTLLFFKQPSFILLLLFLLFLFSLVSFWLRRPHIFSILGRLFWGESKNILVKISSRGRRKKRFILSAHYDTAPQSAFLGPKIGGNLARTLGKIAEKLPPGLRTPFFLANIALGFTLVFMVSWLLGFSPPLLQYLQIVTTAVLFVACAFLLQMCTSPYVPGAFDNGGGVTVLYGLAKKLKKSPLKSIETWLLFNSDEENDLVGIRDFLDRYGGGFNKETTFFINVDAIGAEILHYSIGEADFLGLKHPSDQFLKSLAGLLDNYPDFKKVRPSFLPVGSDAAEILGRGFRCLTISSTNRDGYYHHYHQLSDTFDKINIGNIYLAEKFTLELLEKVDFI